MNKSAFEVIATYQKEETGMDLVIRLPPCYPLCPVDVDCTRSLRISEVKQRKWLLSMIAFIRNQNGALAGAIRIWKSNFDKEFLGIAYYKPVFPVLLARLASTSSTQPAFTSGSRPHTSPHAHCARLLFDILLLFHCEPDNRKRSRCFLTPATMTLFMLGLLFIIGFSFW